MTNNPKATFSPKEWVVLYAVQEATRALKPLGVRPTQADIAKHAGMDKANLNKLLIVLELKGAIRRIEGLAQRNIELAIRLPKRK